MKHHALSTAGRRRVRMTRPRRPAVDNASCRIVASIKRVPLQSPTFHPMVPGKAKGHPERWPRCAASRCRLPPASARGGETGEAEAEQGERAGFRNRPSDLSANL